MKKLKIEPHDELKELVDKTQAALDKHDEGVGKINSSMKTAMDRTRSRDMYLISKPDLGGASGYACNSGDKGFEEFVIEKLHGLMPGLPVPAGVMFHYDKMCDTFAQTDSRAGYPMRFIEQMAAVGIQPKHVLTTESAAYCVLHDIALLDAAKDTCVFTQREGFAAEACEITGCFPDLIEKLTALHQAVQQHQPVPGSVYMTYGHGSLPESVATGINDDEGFKTYIYDELRTLEPGEPTPNKHLIQYKLNDISGLHDSSAEDMNANVQKAFQSAMFDNIGHTLPTHIVPLYEAAYCIRNDIPLFSPEAGKAYLREGYYSECESIRNSLPELTAKLAALQTPQADTPSKVRQVPSMQVIPGKKGHNL